MSENKKVISFSVTEDEKKHMYKLALSKGYSNVSSMCKVAVFQYVNRYTKNSPNGALNDNKVLGDEVID